MLRNKRKSSILLLIILIASCKNDKSDFAEIHIENKIDLGAITLSDTITSKIFIKNRSTEKLKIESIVASCGCTVVSFENHSISKNDSLALDIMFIPDKKGLFEKSVIIDANTDPPFTTFHLIGEVK